MDEFRSTDSHGPNEIRITPRAVLVTLSVIVVLLVLAHAGLQTVRFALGNERVFGLAALFSVGAENNAPAYYSTFSLLLCAFANLLIGIGVRREGARDAGYWFGLAVVFAFLSADENMSLHEHLIEPLRSAWHTSGLLYFAWVIPYGIGTAVFAAFYLRFLMRLPRRTAVLFVVAGAIFILGAIGMEMLGGVLSEAHGTANVPYVAVQTLEEFFEMAGVVLFAYALVEYMAQRFGGLRLRVGAQSG